MKKRCDVGAIVSIPLRSGGFARAVIARADGEGRMFAYFFGPKRSTVNELVSLPLPTAQNAILSGKCGDLALVNGKWSIIGRIEPWEPNDWPLPKFVSDANDPESITITEFDDETLDAKSVRTVSRNSIDWQALPIDMMMGSGSVEIKLTRLLERETVS
jgi:hypothetical protein